MVKGSLSIAARHLRHLLYIVARGDEAMFPLNIPAPSLSVPRRVEMNDY